MKRIISTLLLISVCVHARSEYIDHRGHNVDSLEAVVSRWNTNSIASASDQELMQLSENWRELMLGYLQTNGIKSEYYARKALALGQTKGWKTTIWDSAKILGQHFWAKGQYDSAAVYYSIALEAVQDMDTAADEEKDNGLSAMYGTLGNLYSSMDSTATAMDYYGKALEIFKKHNWATSCAVCYANMGETVLGKKQYRKAEEYFERELACAKEADDSLWIADAWKHFGQLYLERGETLKALDALDKADGYFSLHEDEEIMSRLELLDFTGQVLRLQKKELQWFLYGAIALIILLIALLALLYIHHRTKREKKSAVRVLEETIEELRPKVETQSKKALPVLTERELQILHLIADGKTNPQIAEIIFLSPETVKWYRKKLLAKFDATNSADLVRVAMETGIL